MQALRVSMESRCSRARGKLLRSVAAHAAQMSPWTTSWRELGGSGEAEPPKLFPRKKAGGGLRDGARHASERLEEVLGGEAGRSGRGWRGRGNEVKRSEASPRQERAAAYVRGLLPSESCSPHREPDRDRPTGGESATQSAPSGKRANSSSSSLLLRRPRYRAELGRTGLKPASPKPASLSL